MGDPVVTVAVVADTHVPDRVGELHPGLIPALVSLHPDLILHAGDICSPEVLTALREVAPVEAVRGNRDWLFVRTLPKTRYLTLNGVDLTLVHGQGNFIDYVLDKWYHLHQGYRYERYARIVRRTMNGAQVVVFGHTHRPECIQEGEVLMFNPGSASVGPSRRGIPSFGVLKIGGIGKVEGSIHFLSNLKWNGQAWSTFG